MAKGDAQLSPSPFRARAIPLELRQPAEEGINLIQDPQLLGPVDVLTQPDNL
jgi:hypothetical protein